MAAKQMSRIMELIATVHVYIYEATSHPTSVLIINSDFPNILKNLSVIG